MRFIRVLALLAVAASFACGGDDATNPGDGNGGGNFTVSVVDFAFNPSSLSVPVGSTVNWQWSSTSGTLHNVTFEDGSPGSGDRNTGTFGRTFSAAGDYAYRCSLHPPGMVGTVSVTAGSTGGTDDGGTGGGGGGYP